MTRLISSWVSPMLDGMTEYNNVLRRKIGVDLRGLTADVFGADDESMEKAIENTLVGVVPITQGEGIIGDFCDAIAAIVRSMGFRAIVTEETDVNGIYEAQVKGCNVLFFADDVRYLALNIGSRKAADNNLCTVMGYIAVLDKLMKKHGRNMKNEEILLLGYGILGKEATKLLSGMNVKFSIYDKNKDVLAGTGLNILDKKDEIKNYSFILDFTNEGGWLSQEDLARDVLYASPGVPCSLDEISKKVFSERAIYDNLEIGTAIMLGMAVLT
ncbi:MAG: 3-methylornithyl-N6-L-lysine dehydrogenase PylD [Anaerovoracaceae bacterium]